MTFRCCPCGRQFAKKCNAISCCAPHEPGDTVYENEQTGKYWTVPSDNERPEPAQPRRVSL